MATMKDVARAAGVSIATVSATLSGAAYVSPELQARVRAAVDALDYRPNSVARDLRRGTSSLIGVIVPDITNPFFTEIVHHAQLAARAAGYAVLLAASEEDPVVEAEQVRLMRANRVAGMMLCPAGRPDHTAALLAEVGTTPMVLLDNAPEGLPVDTAVLDNTAAAGLATRHLLEAGHRRIATVAGPARNVPGRERLAGFAATLRAAGIPLDDALVRTGAFRQEDALEAGRALLAVRPRPTAVFVANNHMLVGVMRAVSEAGLSVPGELSIASIDDFPWAAAFVPALTVVRQPVEAMALTAMERLIWRIEGGDGPPERAVHRPELVVRGSTAPLTQAVR